MIIDVQASVNVWPAFIHTYVTHVFSLETKRGSVLMSHIKVRFLLVLIETCCCYFYVCGWLWWCFIYVCIFKAFNPLIVSYDFISWSIEIHYKNGLSVGWGWLACIAIIYNAILNLLPSYLCKCTYLKYISYCLHSVTHSQDLLLPQLPQRQPWNGKQGLSGALLWRLGISCRRI